MLDIESVMGFTDENIVVFGFGAQGSAQAQNLRDSGKDISVFLRPESPLLQKAREANLLVLTDGAKAAQSATVAAVLIPDRQQPEFYREVLYPNLPKGAALVFAHGFAVHYREIVPRPDLDVVLVAPLAQGLKVRSDFAQSAGPPCVIAVAKDATGHAKERALAFAKAMSRGGPFIDSTFAEEVETDLFAEQAVLCGGLPELVRAAFDTLVGAGYNPDIAYFSCLMELKAIAALLDRHSITGMQEHISDTARYGAMTRGPRIVNAAVREEMGRILDEIRSGAFAGEFLSKHRTGGVSCLETMDREHLIERIHKKYHG